ncbi:hypothetical protein BD560DRAFT_404532 [Blakeslea trispora]|nr:hypothetical protein BD560DRAFT_404532 [Blakeslea trispora]
MNTTIEVNTGEQGQATTPVNPVLKSLRVLRKVQDKAAALAQEYEDSCDARNPDMELEEKAAAAFRQARSLKAFCHERFPQVPEFQEQPLL